MPVESTCRGALVVAGGDIVSAARTSVTDIAGPAEDIAWGSLVNVRAVESKNWVVAFDAEDTAAPTTDRTCTGPGATLLAFIAASYNGGSSPGPYASGCAAHARRKASYANTAAARSRPQPLQEALPIPPTARPEES